MTVRDAHKVGDKIECVVSRDGSNTTLSLTIGDSGDYQTKTPSKKEEDEDYDD